MKKLVLVVAVLACTFAAVAEGNSSRRNNDTRIWLPLGLSIITPPIQLPSPSHTVFGGMINLGYGQVENLVVADLGLINNVTDTMMGVELGPVNLAGTCVGVQLGALNIASRTVGVQFGALNFTGDLHGVQLGVLNFSGSGGALIFPILNLGF
jgi:hypothetical protein